MICFFVFRDFWRRSTFPNFLQHLFTPDSVYRHRLKPSLPTCTVTGFYLFLVFRDRFFLFHERLDIFPRFPRPIRCLSANTKIYRFLLNNAGGWPPSSPRSWVKLVRPRTTRLWHGGCNDPRLTVYATPNFLKPAFPLVGPRPFFHVTQS